MKHFLSLLVLLTAWLSAQAAGKTYTLTSPDGRLTVNITTAGILQWAVSHDAATVTLPSPIALHVTAKGTTATWGEQMKVRTARKSEHRATLPAMFYMRSTVADNYNALTLTTNQGYDVEFRAYDDAAVYRFVSTEKTAFEVNSERAEYRFADDHPVVAAYYNNTVKGTRYQSSFESVYEECRLSQLDADTLMLSPMAVCLPGGKKAVVMDAAVEDYPGMFVRKGTRADAPHMLYADFAPIPVETRIRERFIIPVRRANSIARFDDDNAQRHLPWRVLLVTEHDTQLLDNDISWRLSPDNRIGDTAWIKPGKVAWDWWNNWNITGVDFQAGINTETYKYYIDFAAANKLEYIILDEGWSSRESLMEVVPAIDLQAIVEYGKAKGVGIILWATWRNTMRDLDGIFRHYAQMGVKGFKVDFFDRDDQLVVSDVKAISACAAKHHLVLDLHGMHPFGMQRAYPNVLNIEGVKGLENTKWEGKKDGKPIHDFPRYDVTCPYLRTLTGPMDYTPGAMKNATQRSFYGDNGNPMSMGTRCHQLAMYVVYQAPLQMLADSPSKYMKEQESTDFIAQIPTTFDETIALSGEMGEYAVVAKRKGNTWYVGAMTNWTPRDISIDLTPLTLGTERQMEAFSDGVNAHRDATDYRRTQQRVTANAKLEIHLAPGGGWAAIIK